MLILNYGLVESYWATAFPAKSYHDHFDCSRRSSWLSSLGRSGRSKPRGTVFLWWNVLPWQSPVSNIISFVEVKNSLMPCIVWRYFNAFVRYFAWLLWILKSLLWFAVKISFFHSLECHLLKLTSVLHEDSFVQDKHYANVYQKKYLNPSICQPINN